MCPLCYIGGFAALVAGWFGLKKVCKSKKKDRQ